MQKNNIQADYSSVIACFREARAAEPYENFVGTQESDLMIDGGVLERCLYRDTLS